MNWINRQALIFMVATLTALTSCNFNNREQINDVMETSTQIQDSLKAIIHTVFDNSEELNLESAFTPFWNDSNFFFVSNGIKSSYNELKKAEEEYFSSLKQQSFNFPFQNFEVINQDNAITNLVGTMIAVQKDGTTQKSNIAETIVFKKINNTWKIVSGHESYSPANETH